MNNKELKPCPFCGGECVCITYYLYGKITGSSISCKKCHIEQGTPYKSKQSAIKAWNRRVNDER